MKKLANVLGLGLIGGSIAAGLRSRGWTVWGSDLDPHRESDALSRGIIDTTGLNKNASITFVATPVKTITENIERILAQTTGLVTDVGSVKLPIVSKISNDRYIGGHPMAGSELEGLEGADAALFEGAIWILTPRPDASDKTFAAITDVVSELGAEVLALSAASHDELVATVSHVPHLTAATLMSVAHLQSEEHVALLRLAAGGFRDMTRVASGHPGIWLDICETNREAIVDSLGNLIEGLSRVRHIVDEGDREELQKLLIDARVARSNLPSRAQQSEYLSEIKIAIPDKTGAAAEVFTLAAELGVNIMNFEVLHLVEGQRGVMVVVVETAVVDLFKGGLVARGFKPTVTQL